MGDEQWKAATVESMSVDTSMEGARKSEEVKMGRKRGFRKCKSDRVAGEGMMAKGQRGRERRENSGREKKERKRERKRERREKRGAGGRKRAQEDSQPSEGVDKQLKVSPASPLCTVSRAAPQPPRTHLDLGERLPRCLLYPLDCSYASAFEFCDILSRDSLLLERFYVDEEWLGGLAGIEVWVSLKSAKSAKRRRASEEGEKCTGPTM